MYSHVPLSDLPTAVTVSSSPPSLFLSSSYLLDSNNEATRQSKEANYMSFLDTLLPLPSLSLSLSSPQSSILSSLSPDYIFSGHTHHTSSSSHSYTTVDGRERLGTEWVVPTCSYRMGESHMGTGAIFIGETINNNQITLSKDTPKMRTPL